MSHGMSYHPAFVAEYENFFFSADGHWLAVGTEDGRTAVARTPLDGEDETRTSYSIRLQEDSLRLGAFSSDSSLLALVTRKRDVRILELHDGSWRESWRFECPESGTKIVAFSPDRNLLALASYTRSTATIWDLRARRLQCTLQCFESVRNAVFAHTSSRLVVAGEDGAVKIWDLPDTDPVAKFEIQGASLTALCFSPDDRRLLTGDKDGTVRIRSLIDSGGEQSRVIAFELAVLREHDGEIQSLRMTPDGRTLVAAGGVKNERGVVTLWHAPDIVPDD